MIIDFSTSLFVSTLYVRLLLNLLKFILEKAQTGFDCTEAMSAPGSVRFTSFGFLDVNIITSIFYDKF